MPKQTNKGSALAALLGHSSIRDAAKACRLSEETLYRFLRDPAFLKDYRDAGRQTVENAIRRIQQTTSEAADALQRNLHCESPAVEVRTAQIILETAIKGIETLDILDRLEVLENANSKAT